MKPVKDSKKSKMDWYFSRVNGKIVLPDLPKTSSVHRPATVEKNNVEARHRASWRSQARFLFVLLSLVFLSAETLSAAPSVAKETPAPSALVSREAGAMPAAKETPKKKSGLRERDPELVKAATKPKTVQGLVTGVSRQGIAIEYGSDPKQGGLEIWFNYVEGMKYSGFEDLSQLAEGDTVGVEYKEAADHRKLVDKLTLVAKKAVEPVAPEGAALEAKPAA